MDGNVNGVVLFSSFKVTTGNFHSVNKTKCANIKQILTIAKSQVFQVISNPLRQVTSLKTAHQIKT